MKKAKIPFAIITLAAFALTLFALYNLKGGSGDLGKNAMLGWGAIFIVSALTVVRGIKYLGQ